MAKRVIRVYADTSVFGGAFDDEFSFASRAFFDQVVKGRFALVISGMVQREILAAPAQVRVLYGSMAQQAEMFEATSEALKLRSAYLGAGIVTQRWAADALHVALATAAGCAMIVSWNFAHIVHFNKVPLYNAVNELNGFGRIAILSPPEVIGYEDESEEI